MKGRLPGLVSLAVSILLSATVAAQTPAPVRPGTPQRDTPGAAQQKGTGVIRGRVVNDTGRPLRRARITVSAPELGAGNSRTTSTDSTGRYDIKDLRPARYRVQVARSGYLPLEYGQRRPGEQGRPVQLADGETVEKIDFALPRMGVLTGRVIDETGEPMEGVTVLALRSLFYEGRRKLVPIAQAQTDDEGEYRVQKLPPQTDVMMSRAYLFHRSESSKVNLTAAPGATAVGAPFGVLR